MYLLMCLLMYLLMYFKQFYGRMKLEVLAFLKFKGAVCG